MVKRTTDSAPFTLRLLGSPRVDGPDGDVGLPLGKPLAALCYVALEPSSVSRADLATVLWPSAPESRARASIRQALWLIRKHTDARAVSEDDGVLRLEPALLTTDLSELEAALAADRLDDALLLWNGGLLHNFTIPEAQPWLAWADDARSRWEGRLGRALEARAATCEGEERAAWLRHALAVRPYRVEAWSDLLQAHVDLRDVDGASEALARLREVAQDEDSDRVRDAEERLRLLKRASFGAPEERLTPEFVGRSKDFAVLVNTWRSALSGRSRVIGVMGPAGIGKSALATEVIRYTQLEDALAVEVRGVRTEVTFDLGVVGSLVADLLRRPGAAGISEGSRRILRTLVPSEAEVVTPAPRAALVADALSDILDAVSHEHPLILVVDDAHWMDRPSAIVLLRALRQLDAARVLMIWTCRTGPGGEGESEPSISIIRDAASEGAAALLELTPLAEAEVAEMVTLLLAEEDPERLSRLATRIYLASGGSPLHVVEILRSLRDRDLVTLDDEGRWILAGGAADQLVTATETLENTLAHRVEDLSEGARRFGRRLAAETSALTPEQLGVNGGRPDPDAVAALAELLRRGLVRWTRDDRLELTHGELAEALAPPPRDPPAAERPFRRPIGVALVLVLVTVLAVAFWPEPVDGPTAPLFGGGVLWLDGDGVFYGWTLHDGDDPWQPSDTLWVPRGLSVQTTSLVLDSDRGWMFGGMSIGNQAEAPDAVLVTGERIDTVFASSGDDVLNRVAPNGSAALVSVQHPDTSRFRHMLVRVDLSPARDTAVLASGSASYVPRDWSSDGRWILGAVDAAWDSVFVADPGGRRLATIPAPDAGLPHALFCGPDRVLFETRPAGALAAHWLWEPRGGEPEPLSTELVPNHLPMCSPDGTALAYLATVEQRTLLVVEPRGDGDTRTMDVTDAGVRGMYWAPMETPVASSIEIAAPPRPLARGERESFTASVLDRHALPMDQSVEWSSADPTIASVTAAGLVTANRPGRTEIRATVNGWITAAVDIEVSEEVLEGQVALSDSFPDLDLDRWVPMGDPEPSPIQFEGRPALDMDGDGRLTDGIGSREAYDLTGGGTLEAVFRMEPFVRDDRNRIVLCLTDSDLGENPEDAGGWVQRQSACITWPSGEGFDFQPGAVGLSGTNGALGPTPVDTLLAPDRWNRMSLQIRPDGQVSAVVADSVVAVHPVPLVNDSTVRWRILVVGHAVENRLLLRDLTLWHEERIPSGLPLGQPPG